MTSPRNPNCLSDIFDDAWETIAPYVWMCIYEYIVRSSMLMKDLKNRGNVASFLASGKEFPVAVSSGSSLSETIVGIGIDGTLLC